MLYNYIVVNITKQNSQKKKYRWLRNIFISVYHLWASRKYKLRLLWDSILFKSEWLKLRKQTTNAGEDVRNREPKCTVD